MRIIIVMLRVALGWLYFYAGVTKLLDPAWSAAGYLSGAKTFPGFFHWLASPGVLPFTNALNAWGLTLIGAALILGIAVRLASVFGVLLMALYYVCMLEFPYPDAHSFIVDEHVIYALLLLFLSSVQAGRVWGLQPWASRLPIVRRFPRIRGLLE
jgi:thiosulfate dehydrogenase [quinone] large subunit